MNRATGTCGQPGCPNPPTYRGRCAQHADYNPNPDRQRGRPYMRRRRALIRAAFGRCLRCGNGGALELHHLDGNPSNDDPANTEPWCRDCHAAATREQRQLGLGID